jgi:hypothetical protein
MEIWSAQIYPAFYLGHGPGPSWISARSWPSYRAGLRRASQIIRSQLRRVTLSILSFRLANLGRNSFSGFAM